jgi:hypothetical protein
MERSGLWFSGVAKSIPFGRLAAAHNTHAATPLANKGAESQRGATGAGGVLPHEVKRQVQKHETLRFQEGRRCPLRCLNGH